MARMGEPTPFEVRWSDAEVGAVLQKVRDYPWPVAPQVEDGWAYGCDARYLRELCAFWTQAYDWRGAVAELNRFPQFRARVEDIDLHFVHVIGEAGGRRPLLLVHGWPGSHYEFWDCIEKLAFPSRFGLPAEEAFDIVAPSLPGFGFSGKPAAPIGPKTAARLLKGLMVDSLGYDAFLAQGGDWGALVTTRLAMEHARHVRGLHLNMIGLAPAEVGLTPEETAWAERQRDAMENLGAYAHLQRTKPQSAAWLAAGNPVGQAAWIAERFYTWSDRRRGDLDAIFPKSKLLTNIMIYVMTGSFTTGAWFYRGSADEGRLRLEPGQRCEAPTGFASYPHEQIGHPPPRSVLERAYNLVHWSEIPRGGHFAAMEEPDLFIEDVRAWGRALG